MSISQHDNNGKLHYGAKAGQLFIHRILLKNKPLSHTNPLSHPCTWTTKNSHYIKPQKSNRNNNAFPSFHKCLASQPAGNRESWISYGSYNCWQQNPAEEIRADVSHEEIVPGKIRIRYMRTTQDLQLKLWRKPIETQASNAGILHKKLKFSPRVQRLQWYRSRGFCSL